MVEFIFLLIFPYIGGRRRFYYLEPDAGAGVDGRPEDVHLAQQGGGRGGVVLGGAGRDQVGGPPLLASLVVFRGVLAVEVRQCLLSTGYVPIHLK